jgi:hypothetical protein
MVPLYTLFLAALAALRRLLAKRAARLEQKYTIAARAAELAGRPVRPGNASSADALSAAKRQYELGRLVQHRDVLETKYLSWQAKADRVGALLYRLRNLKGRAVPYLFGITDVALALVVLHLLGLPHGLNPVDVRTWADGLVK